MCVLSIAMIGMFVIFVARKRGKTAAPGKKEEVTSGEKVNRLGQVVIVSKIENDFSASSCFHRVWGVAVNEITKAPSCLAVTMTDSTINSGMTYQWI